MPHALSLIPTACVPPQAQPARMGVWWLCGFWHPWSNQCSACSNKFAWRGAHTCGCCRPSARGYGRPKRFRRFISHRVNATSYTLSGRMALKLFSLTGRRATCGEIICCLRYLPPPFGKNYAQPSHNPFCHPFGFQQHASCCFLLRVDQHHGDERGNRANRLRNDRYRRIRQCTKRNGGLQLGPHPARQGNLHERSSQCQRGKAGWAN